MTAYDQAHANMPCTAGGDCETVANSTYAHLHLAGSTIPVAGLGTVGYLVIFALSMLRFYARPAIGRQAVGAASVLACGGAIYSWYLQYVAHFKLDAFCQWCFTSAFLMTALAAMLVYALRNPDVALEPSTPANASALDTLRAQIRRTRLVAVVQLVALAVLAFASQAIYQRAKIDAAAAVQAPTFGGTAAAPAGPSSVPTQINIDFPTWVNILQHTDSQIRGPMRAPYTFVEIGDFQCPTCAMVRPVIEKVVDHNKINMFFINMPLTIHKWAVPASEAAFAAAAQGKFWAMYDALYTHQDALDPSHYEQYANAAGIDGARLAAEVSSQKYMPQLQTSMAFCTQIKVTATPTMVIHNNVTGDTAVAVGLDQINTAMATNDWKAYDSVDMNPPASTSSKKHS
jgi:protein-disulfide isomerase/uncharacterized membrane protein